MITEEMISETLDQIENLTVEDLSDLTPEQEHKEKLVHLNAQNLNSDDT